MTADPDPRERRETVASMDCVACPVPMAALVSVATPESVDLTELLDLPVCLDPQVFPETLVCLDLAVRRESHRLCP